MKKIPLQFTEGQYELLKEEKIETGCSINSIIRNLVIRHFRQEGKL